MLLQRSNVPACGVLLPQPRRFAVHTEGGGHEELVSNGLMLSPQSPSK
jgi:hypothetical protein